MKIKKILLICLMVCLILTMCVVPSFAEDDVAPIDESVDTISVGRYVLNYYDADVGSYGGGLNIVEETPWFTYNGVEYCGIVFDNDDDTFYLYRNAEDPEYYSYLRNHYSTETDSATACYIDVIRPLSAYYEDEYESAPYDSFRECFTRGEIIPEGTYTIYTSAIADIFTGTHSVNTVGEYNQVYDDVDYVPCFKTFYYSRFDESIDGDVSINAHSIIYDEGVITFADDFLGEYVIAEGEFITFDVTQDTPVDLESYEVFTSLTQVPPAEDSFLSIFTGVGTFIAGSVFMLSDLFYVDGSLTFLGVLSVAALSIAVVYLLIVLISKFLKFRG